MMKYSAQTFFIKNIMDVCFKCTTYLVSGAFVETLLRKAELQKRAKPAR